MDITFILCPNIIGILGLILLLIFTRFNFYLDRKRLGLFITASIINIAIIVVEVADYFLGHADFETAYLIRRFTSATGFALTPIIPLLIAYIASKNHFSHWLMLPAAANIVLSYASIFTGHLFQIAYGNSYVRGPIFPVMITISSFYLLLLVFVSFRNLHTVRSSESLFLIGIVSIIALGNILEIAFSFHFVIWNSCAVLLICYYLYLHIQFFKFDPLTNVFNRNMFNYDIDNFNKKDHICAFSFDLNGLKEINDTLGHEQGDAYIISAAELINDCFKKIGKLYRIGGDEFVVLTSKLTEEEAIRYSHNFFEICKSKNISVACGYAYDSSAKDISQLLRDADNAMYVNKRNRILNK